MGWEDFLVTSTKAPARMSAAFIIEDAMLVIPCLLKCVLWGSLCGQVMATNTVMS